MYYNTVVRILCYYEHTTCSACMVYINGGYAAAVSAYAPRWAAARFEILERLIIMHIIEQN